MRRRVHGAGTSIQVEPRCIDRRARSFEPRGVERNRPATRGDRSRAYVGDVRRLDRHVAAVQCGIDVIAQWAFGIGGGVVVYAVAVRRFDEQVVRVFDHGGIRQYRPVEPAEVTAEQDRLAAGDDPGVQHLPGDDAAQVLLQPDPVTDVEEGGVLPHELDGAAWPARPGAGVTGMKFWEDLQVGEKKRFGAIVVLFLASVVFWAGFEQVTPAELWETHQSLKNRLIVYARRRLVEQARRRKESDERIAELHAQLARRYEAPRLRPPFNEEARRAAGFTDEEIAWLS